MGKKHPSPAKNHLVPILQPLSSPNISKMLSHFMTFRSTIRELSQSLQRMEKMLDSTYQMFEIAQNIMTRRNRPPLLPEPDRNPPQNEQENLPIIDLPDNNEGPIDSPFAHLFRQIDPRFLFQLLQSPFVQRFISQFFAAPNKTAAKKVKYVSKRKHG